MPKQSKTISLSPKLEEIITKNEIIKSPRLGWGGCWECNCQGFEGITSYTCANSHCGHSWDDHS